MFSYAIALVLCISSTGQNPNNGSFIRVAVDRNNNWIDSVWNYTNAAGSTMVGYERDGDTNPSASWVGNSPDCDVDDNGNSVVVYQNTGTNNVTSVYLVVNLGTPIVVSTNAFNPSVTISRTTGQIAVTWGAINSQVNTYSQILASTYSYNSNTRAVTLTTAQFQVNNTISSATYSIPDISSDVGGNYVISYARVGNTPGTFVARFTAGTKNAIYTETAISGASTTYYLTRVSSWSNGECVVVLIGTDTTHVLLYSVHLTASGATKTGTSTLQYGFVTPGGNINAYIFPEEDNLIPINLGVACLRSTPGSYIVSWPSQAVPPGTFSTTNSGNIVCWPVKGDVQQGRTPTFYTSFSDPQPNSGEIYNVWPSVAMTDTSSNGSSIYYVVWGYSPEVSGPMSQPITSQSEGRPF